MSRVLGLPISEDCMAYIILMIYWCMIDGLMGTHANNVYQISAYLCYADAL